MAKVKVTANDSWTVSIPSGVTWVHPDKTLGDGDGEIDITVDANLRAEARITTVTVATKGGASKTIAISQDSAESSLSLSQSTLAFNADGTEKAA